jgi:hypothetical protein
LGGHKSKEVRKRRKDIRFQLQRKRS